MIKSVVAAGVVSILWVVVGYSLCFGESFHGIIGNPFTHLFFKGVSSGAPWSLAPSIPLTLFALFQLMFAIITPGLVVGAVAERIRFTSYILFIALFSLFVYAPIAHWTWHPDGFLFKWGVLDFAGGTVVHMSAGFAALAASIYLRDKGEKKSAISPANIPFVLLGTGLLWFGWYGFNPGSTLSAMDFEGIGRVATNTTLAACAAGLTAMIYAYIPNKKWDVSFTVNGFLAGLVAITCPCYWVSPTGAILLGGVAGVIVVAGVELLEWLRIDDPIGAVPVHGICGIWGTLSLGLFACGKYGATGPVAPDNSAPLTGLFYGGGTQVLIAQAIGSLIVTSATFSVAMAVMYLVNLTGTLRVSAEGAVYGLDLHEHGISAYPEYVISALAAPAGMSSQPHIAEPSPSLAAAKALQRVAMETKIS